MPSQLRLVIVSLTSCYILSGCGDGSSTHRFNCKETGDFACQSGATEPLYRFQWHLDAASSYFSLFPMVSDGVTDLNVRSVHEAGIKGHGVNVLVLDQGVEIAHEDLAENIDRTMSFNFDNGTDDPTPTDIHASHGTHVAGIIAAAQNGFGVMGIAPKSKIGGANLVGHETEENIRLAFGKANWSKQADIFVFMAVSNGPSSFDESYANIASLKDLTQLRNQKGALMVKPAGNTYYGGRVAGEFVNCKGPDGGILISSCGNSMYDTDNQLPTAIVVAAATAKGSKAKYSTAGSVNWITAPSDPGASRGDYGELDGKISEFWEWGPAIFSTDLTGCERGYSRVYNPAEMVPRTQFEIAGTQTNQSNNLNKSQKATCNYAHGGGTSSAGPSVAGVIALMMAANPQLSWRDIRDILRKTANSRIDPDYGQMGQRNKQINLATHEFCEGSDPALVEGSRCARVDYGWQTNASGNRYSNWYGFGFINAKAAVDAAINTRTYKPATLKLAAFSNVTANGKLSYGQVSQVGQFYHPDASAVDAIQLRLNSVGEPICHGLLGIYVQSPSGTVSILQTPYNILQNAPGNTKYLEENDDLALTSYAFHGESSQGLWKIFAVSGASNNSGCMIGDNGRIKVDYRILAIP